MRNTKYNKRRELLMSDTSQRSVLVFDSGKIWKRALCSTVSPAGMVSYSMTIRKSFVGRGKFANGLSSLHELSAWFVRVRRVTEIRDSRRTVFFVWYAYRRTYDCRTKNEPFRWILRLVTSSGFDHDVRTTSESRRRRTT